MALGSSIPAAVIANQTAADSSSEFNKDSVSVTTTGNTRRVYTKKELEEIADKISVRDASREGSPLLKPSEILALLLKFNNLNNKEAFAELNNIVQKAKANESQILVYHEGRGFVAEGSLEDRVLRDNEEEKAEQQELEKVDAQQRATIESAQNLYNSDPNYKPVEAVNAQPEPEPEPEPKAEFIPVPPEVKLDDLIKGTTLALSVLGVDIDLTKLSTLQIERINDLALDALADDNKKQMLLDYLNESKIDFNLVAEKKLSDLAEASHSSERDASSSPSDEAGARAELSANLRATRFAYLTYQEYITNNPETVPVPSAPTAEQDTNIDVPAKEVVQSKDLGKGASPNAQTTQNDAVLDTDPVEVASSISPSMNVDTDPVDDIAPRPKMTNAGEDPVNPQPEGPSLESKAADAKGNVFASVAARLGNIEAQNPGVNAAGVAEHAATAAADHVMGVALPAPSISRGVQASRDERESRLDTSSGPGYSTDPRAP